MSTIVFSHANSFPASTYRILFRLLQERGFRVSAVERFGHDTRYPVTSNWPHLVQQLADHAREQQQRSGERAFFVGHSLGGYLSLMAAAMHPDLARGVVLIDSPLVSGWKAGAVGMAKQVQVIGSLTPGRISRARRNTWPSREEALEHFRRKKAFARWDAAVLQDYISSGLVPRDDGQFTLAFDRAVETQIYNTLPHNLAQLLRRQPLQCPAAFLGGRASHEMAQVGMAFTQRITQGRTMMLDGSHLFPMEQPRATAAAIEAALLNLQTQEAPQRQPQR
ncbi:MAG: alpha/beta hydrolase [Comamonas sp. SCN 65-56]|uniref:alpha/beta fold hydrolase n=1 Tax=Comamonas sp. SCN 65-56 TaxID=1660095 RepID=UPI0008686F68|nr:alpha/beta hydrolase [Comamonas sp. SCN 65-56]ODS92115.1 MAG: alpha/beta hydrolase [Comamonas sp. SCN 65-56]